MISSSGCNLVPVEMAAGFRERGVKVVAIITRRPFRSHAGTDPDGKKLQDFADLVLDTGAPAGDAMVSIPGLETPVSPGSTIGGCLLVNAIKAEVAARLTAAGQPPKGAQRRGRGRERARRGNFRSRLRRARPPHGAALRRIRHLNGLSRMKNCPLRTSVIGSYPFPGWLEFACQHLDQFGAADMAEVQDDAVIAALHDQMRRRPGRDHGRRADAAGFQSFLLRAF